MRLTKFAPVQLSLFQVVWGLGCQHDHGHELSKRAIVKPTRPLEWGDINIIHTTDSHGWLLGHQKSTFPEPNYSADLGDFSSFVTRMKKLALDKDVDLLLVDSGDLHDGTGLSDGFPPGGVDGQASNEFLKQLPYDVMAIGNHELYIYNITLDMHKNFAPALKGRYLSSNVNLTIPDPQNSSANISVPVGSQFAKFKTRKGRSVTALGVLFEFTGNDKRSTVQKVADMVTEPWFLDAIREEPDFFLLVGHMPVARDKWPVVFDAIRAIHPTTPILILGGHTHIRDCLQLDGRSMALESGRYMETVGWLSAKLDAKGSTKNITFSRRYLDTNRVTYEFHTNTRNSSFDTPKGLSIRKGLNSLFQKFDLGFQYGTAPQDYFINRAPYPSNSSLISLFIEKAVPTAVAINNTRADIPSYYILQAGSQRFDLYSGPFTKDDQLTASPFTNAFVFIPNVTLSTAMKVLPVLNGDGGGNLSRRAEESRERELYASGEVEHRYNAWLEEMYKKGSEAMEKRESESPNQSITLGYVTQDACPGVGDDTPHIPLPVFPTPNNVASLPPPNASNDTAIDFVFSDFIQPDVLTALNSIQNDKTYTNADVSSYSPILFNAVLGLYAQEAWSV